MLGWRWWVSLSSMLCLLVVEAVVLNAVLYRRVRSWAPTTMRQAACRWRLSAWPRLRWSPRWSSGTPSGRAGRAFTRDTDEVAPGIAIEVSRPPRRSPRPTRLRPSTGPRRPVTPGTTQAGVRSTSAPRPPVWPSATSPRRPEPCRRAWRHLQPVGSQCRGAVEIGPGRTRTRNPGIAVLALRVALTPAAGRRLESGWTASRRSVRAVGPRSISGDQPPSSRRALDPPSSSGPSTVRPTARASTPLRATCSCHRRCCSHRYFGSVSDARISRQHGREFLLPANTSTMSGVNRQVCQRRVGRDTVDVEGIGVDRVQGVVAVPGQVSEHLVAGSGGFAGLRPPPPCGCPAGSPATGPDLGFALLQRRILQRPDPSA